MSYEALVLLDPDQPCKHNRAGEHEDEDGEWCYGMREVRLRRVWWCLSEADEVTCRRRNFEAGTHSECPGAVLVGGA